MSQSTDGGLATLGHTVPDGVIRRAALRAAGVSNHAVSARCRPSGPWQRVLPGVVLLSSGRPTRRQQLRAALAYAGEGAVITGVDALRQHGVNVRCSGDVVVLVPAKRRVASRAYLTVERTTRPPEPIWHDGLPLAPVARATLDAARREQDHDQLRALLFAPVRAGACTVAHLRAELDAGSQRGSAAPRALLARHGPGVLPVAVGWARRLLRDGPLPPPSWHVPLHDRWGTSLGIADVWWDEVGLAWDVGAQRLVRPTRYERLRTAPLTAAGITVVCTEPQRLCRDPDGVLRDLCSAFLRASKGPRPSVRGW